MRLLPDNTQKEVAIILTKTADNYKKTKLKDLKKTLFRIFLSLCILKNNLKS